MPESFPVLHILANTCLFDDSNSNMCAVLLRCGLSLHFPNGFPDSSVGKESACNTGDPGSILGSGRSAGEGIGYPLQYSWASPMAQLVKNLHAMQEIWD